MTTQAIFDEGMRLCSDIEVSLNTLAESVQAFVAFSARTNVDLLKQIKDAEPRLALLDALEAGGVDNWEWYGESTSHLYADEEDADDA